jgi:transposase
MIRKGFLSADERADLIAVARDGLAEHRVGRRANAILLVDRGMSCTKVASVLFLDDDSIRTWCRRYKEAGISWLMGFGHHGSECRMSAAQCEQLKSWIADRFPSSTREIGVWIAEEFGISYQSRSGLVALLHRLGVVYRKPKARIPGKLDETTQQAFIEGYNTLLNNLPGDEAVLFADAVHPTHGARPAGCWAPKEVKLALDQSSGRQRLNIHGAIDLESGQTRMIEVLSVDAKSTIALLSSIENLHPTMRRIHVFLDNARYHHANIVQEWLAWPGRRIKLHFVPAYCPHLNPIERLWGLMHKTLTHNRCYATFREFCDALLYFLKEKVPKNWDTLCDNVSDNFRVISPKDFRILT